MKRVKIDLPFLISIGILVVAGFLIFSSASLGLLSKQPEKYANVSNNQIFLGLALGLLACFVTSHINYKLYRKYSFFLFISSILVTLLVFIPGLGFAHGGAHRWVEILGISFQPSEFLKIGFIIFLSAWMADAKDKAGTFKYGFLPLAIVSAVVAGVLLLQPDTDTFLITVCAGLAIFVCAGGKWRYIFASGAAGVALVAIMAFTHPYVMSRIQTFIHPEANGAGSGYQIQQSLIAIGSGGISGRGFGQSIQKFDTLPEPIGDSIFAVASEEFGFIGSAGIIILFLFFAFRGLKIATQTTDPFGRLMVVGIVILITAQAFVNIGAMVGILPLSGITLPFISHGGTALFMTLAEVGIILNISKTRKKTA